jgi:CRISPR-associated protein (TIGR03986 family)
MTVGKLVVNKKNVQVEFTNAKGKTVSMNIKESEMSDSLTQLKLKAIAQLNGLEVELEVVGGQPSQVREKGKPFQTPKANANNQNQPVGNRRVITAPNANQALREPEVKGDFHNPYNFVPCLPRKDISGDLGDRNPLTFGMGHSVYQSDRWSGRISVTLTTKTPLLIPDIFDSEVSNGQEKGHKTFPLRIGADGKPYLPPTSIKGMLRSAYEAITNSRFGVFEKHSDRLAYRMSTSTGLQMVPARIEKSDEEQKICLYTGTSEIRDDGTPDEETYAAWLPYYTAQPIKYADGTKPCHGDNVKAWIELFQHHRWDRRRNQHVADCKLWRVRSVARHNEQLSTIAPRPTNDNGASPNRSYYKPLNKLIKISGYVCITNCNIDRKHDERIFFTGDGFDTVNIPLAEDDWKSFTKQWKELITNYQDNEDYKRNLPKPSALGGRNTTWSRHIKEGQSEQSLRHETLCYAHVERDEDDRVIVKALYPVMISRGLFEVAPEMLLSSTLHPATCMDKLSPADRVFGWVNQDKSGKGAYKGNLRIHSVKCGSDNSIHKFDGDGLPLAILGEPKPQQARFYVARDDEGTRLKNGVEKQTGYSKGAKNLRGRKVYPHHQLPLDVQEYSQNERSDQNRSIRAWVKEDVEFTFDIDVTNLSDVELGGLLWLLTLPPDHYHRLGGGKPFGFGSVSLEINWDNTDLRKGDRWKEFYSDLSLIANPNLEQPQGTVEIFQKEVGAVYGNGSFPNAKFIKAFCQAAQGFADGKPIHYPRRRRLRDPENKIFDWFVENESPRGQKLSLPDLANEVGLPYYP